MNFSPHQNDVEYCTQKPQLFIENDAFNSNKSYMHVTSYYLSELYVI